MTLDAIRSIADRVEVIGDVIEPNANPIAKPATVADIIDEYEKKSAALADALERTKAAVADLAGACSVMGEWGNHSAPRLDYAHERDLRAALLVSGWKAVYSRLGIAEIASAKDKKEWERTLADPPALTMETAKATFGDYIMNPRAHILRGMAEAFADLDPAYKSHEKVKIGVKGLPKRVILGNWGGFYSSYGRDQFRNMANALATYQGKPHLSHDESRAIDDMLRTCDAVLDGRTVEIARRHGEPERIRVEARGLTVRTFANGNAHIFFDAIALADINKALAEFYGDVLPDAEPEGVKPRASTAVAKDLQFYWTPKAVIDRMLDRAGIYERMSRAADSNEPKRVLEPSCGDGRILDALAPMHCRTLGIEVHTGRAAQAKAKGHSVLTANFLNQPAAPEFDAVIMNPPFFGKHYVKHIRHAMKFLKPRGVLVAVLPATARYDHKQLDDLRGTWEDLPVGSFTEAGTNVPTVLFKAAA